MEFPSCAAARSAEKLGGHVNEPLRSRIRRVTAKTSGRTLLCALCSSVCVLVGPRAQALATTVTLMPGDQTFIVPAGVSSLEVSAAGAQGEGTELGEKEKLGKNVIEPGGKGELVSGELSVMPGEMLDVDVAFPESGEASDVRAPEAFGSVPDDRLIVAGAGGAAGHWYTFGDADEAAEHGGNASERGEGRTGGAPGSQTSGGAGGKPPERASERFEENEVEIVRHFFCGAGHNGELEVGGSGDGEPEYGGGHGVEEVRAECTFFRGGRGGDGYYGGGSGAEGIKEGREGPGGGGGGSSLVPVGGREEGLTTEPKVQITYGGPAAVTDAASPVQRNSATLNATVDPEGEGVSDCHFEYGTTPAYGTTIPCPTSPGSGTSPVLESVELSGLKADTTYYYRIVATNPTATRHGHNVSFATANPPTIVTDPATGVEQNIATLNATVNPEGTTLSDCHFEYGLSTSYGTSVPCSPEPEPGVKEPVPVSASLAGLTLATTYHFGIVAANLSGTSEGKDLTFQTLGSRAVVTKLSPTRGPAGGGMTITITGKFLTGATAVEFGSLNAADFLVKSATSIVAESPGEEARTVDVRVTTPNGTSIASSADHFKFGPPMVTSISPNTGGTEGNNQVTITGTGFGLGSEATLFKFGSTEATTVDCTSSTSCTVAVPSHVAGTVEVKATVSGQSSPKAAPADQYTYG